MFKKINKNKKKIIITISILIFFFIANNYKIFGEAFSAIKHYFENVLFQEEVKKISFKSDGYETDTPGDYKVEKSAGWTGRNEATIEFNVNTNIMSDNKDKDVIFVLDTSGSMVGDKYERLSNDSIELISRLLDNPANTVSLISFDSDVEILAEYSKDKETLVDLIENFEIYGATDYYLALTAVDEVLDGYVVQEDRDCIIVFLTDGFPTQSNNNQLAEFEILNSKYPFTKIYGVQYEMGIDITEELKEVSHEQYSIEINTLKNILFDIALQPYRYDDFVLTDYIDNKYFYVESLDDITTTMGTIILEEDENGQQKIRWNINGDNFYSGAEANLKIKVKLKEEYQDLGGYYPTNTGAEVEASIVGDDKNSSTTNTPVLKHGYNVLYDMNNPNGCELENIDGGSHYAYEKIEINSTKPTCSGYVFRGWKPTSEIEYVNSDYYLMPARDLTFKATWSKMDINKGMDGTVYNVITLYETIQNQAVLDNIPSTYVTGSQGIDFKQPASDTNGKGIYTIASTENDEYPIYYYRGEVDNNVIFAGYCWKIIRTTETGGIKLIYNGTPSSTGTCNTTSANASAFKSKFNPINYSRAVGYSGYMNNDLTGTAKDFVYRSRSSSSLFGNSVTYDTSTKKYTLVDTKTLGELIDTETDLASHHYYCKDASATCTDVYYVVSIYGNRTANNPDDDAVYSIKLTNGKTIEDLLEASIIGEHTDINKNPSTLKTSLDNWYTNNFVNYTPYLENTIYCNDRTVNDWAGLNPNGTKSLQDSTLFYDVFYRSAQGKPTHECRQVDSFTLSTANGGTEGYGNNKLKYPVGIITTDEVVYAGATQNHANRNYFLYLDGASYATYTMSAYSHNSDGSTSGWQIYPTVDYTPQGGLDYSGSINGGYMHTSLGIRPVISLKNNMSYGKGDGTVNNPYVILTD